MKSKLYLIYVHANFSLYSSVYSKMMVTVNCQKIEILYVKILIRNRHIINIIIILLSLLLIHSKKLKTRNY